MLRLAARQMFFGVNTQPLLQLWQCSGGQCKAHRKGVAAKAREQIGAAFDGVEQLESVDRPARAMSHVVFDADDDSRLGRALDHARGQNADDAAMPALAIDDQQAICGQLRIAQPAAFQSR